MFGNSGVPHYTRNHKCDSAICCMHVILLHVCQFMLCMDCESEMKIYYNKRRTEMGGTCGERDRRYRSNENMEDGR